MSEKRAILIADLIDPEGVVLSLRAARGEGYGSVVLRRIGKDRKNKKLSYDEACTLALARAQTVLNAVNSRLEEEIGG